MTPRPSVHLLITDLDNTLYDWISYFSAALSRMVGVAAGRLDVPRERLLDELREVHRESGNTEQPFALAHTRSVRKRYPGWTLEERARALEPAFAAFNAARREHLVLYPGVAETLREVRRRGLPVVGLTDAMWPNAVHRLRMLEIEEHFTHLYAASPDAEHWADPMQAGGYPESPVRLVKLRTTERKPSSSGLRRICADLGTPPERSVYVGDSLVRDVGMAQEVGARTAWATFGQVADMHRWEEVARVTHWSADEVARDRDAPRDTATIEPDAVLEADYSELLDAFEFVAWPASLT